MLAKGIRFVEQIMQTVLRVFRVSVLSLSITGLVGAVMVEASAFIFSHHLTTVTHLLAVTFGFVLGYAVALTYAIIECAIGVARVARYVEQEFAQEEKAIGNIARLAERTLIGR